MIGGDFEKNSVVGGPVGRISLPTGAEWRQVRCGGGGRRGVFKICVDVEGSGGFGVAKTSISERDGVGAMAAVSDGVISSVRGAY